MLHVDINQYSPDLIKAVYGITNENSSKPNLSDSIKLMGNTLKKMNTRRKLMWKTKMEKLQ